MEPVFLYLFALPALIAVAGLVMMAWGYFSSEERS